MERSPATLAAYINLSQPLTGGVLHPLGHHSVCNKKTNNDVHCWQTRTCPLYDYDWTGVFSKNSLKKTHSRRSTAGLWGKASGADGSLPGGGGRQGRALFWAILKHAHVCFKGAEIWQGHFSKHHMMNYLKEHWFLAWCKMSYWMTANIARRLPIQRNWNSHLLPNLSPKCFHQNLTWCNKHCQVAVPPFVLYYCFFVIVVSSDSLFR